MYLLESKKERDSKLESKRTLMHSHLLVHSPKTTRARADAG